uniref:Uncharacterized protein n=1 Tax=Ralstonia solanacearum TaxID=305 RepID=A0A0S4VAQ3_RALSL|nr:protein of unknown function [Ralstonia solanacearum]
MGGAHGVPRRHPAGLCRAEGRCRRYVSRCIAVAVPGTGVRHARPRTEERRTQDRRDARSATGRRPEVMAGAHAAPAGHSPGGRERQVQRGNRTDPAYQRGNGEEPYAADPDAAGGPQPDRAGCHVPAGRPRPRAGTVRPGGRRPDGCVTGLRGRPAFDGSCEVFKPGAPVSHAGPGPGGIQTRSRPTRVHPLNRIALSAFASRVIKMADPAPSGPIH